MTRPVNFWACVVGVYDIFYVLVLSDTCRMEEKEILEQAEGTMAMLYGELL